MYKPGEEGYMKVRDAYDSIVSRRLNRRRELMVQLEKACAEQDQADIEELSTTLHEAYNEGATKADLRHATRQYGSPKFNDLWDAVPYDGIPVEY